MFVPHAETVLFPDLFILVLDLLLVFLAHGFPQFCLFFEMGGDLREITFAKIFDQFTFSLIHRFAPIGGEVIVENLFRGVIMIEHASIERHDLFGRIFQFHFRTYKQRQMPTGARRDRDKPL